MDVDKAYDALPTDAQWFCSFGNPGEGGFVEMWRTPAGDRWAVTNGPWYLVPCQFDWQCRRVGAGWPPPTIH